MPAQDRADANGKPSIYMSMNHMPTDASGGREGGYVFTELAHLDRVIAQWQIFHDGIEKDGNDIMLAAQNIVAPAGDPPSGSQAAAAKTSLMAGRNHNEAMRLYAKNYLDRLKATRAQYAADDEGSADRMRNAGPE